MPKLRVGFIGAGQNTRERHLPGLRAIDDVELCAVANRSVESARRVADEWDLPRVYAHWRAIVDDPELDAVVIGTWPYLHAPATIAALAAGKHVLCEARMALDTASARAMLAAAQQSDRVAMLVPSPFGLAGDRTMRRLLAAGAEQADGYVGQVREVIVRGLADSLASATVPRSWRQRADLSGVNVLTLGILNETVHRWLGQTASVMAQESLFVSRRPDRETGQLADVDTPDCVAVLARLTSGAQCVYLVSGQASHGGPLRIEIFGSNGTIEYDLSSDGIRAARVGDAALADVPIPADERGRWQVEEDFVAAIRQGRPVTRTSFPDGVKYMAFTEAVRRSAATGRRVALSEV